MKQFILEHKVASFFVLTFFISWIGILLVSLQTGIPASENDFNQLLPVAMIPYLLGPGIASLVLTLAIDGLPIIYLLCFFGGWVLGNSYLFNIEIKNS